MTKKSILAILGTVLFSLIVMSILYAISGGPVHYNQEFTRHFSQGSIRLVNTLTLEGDSYYIAGTADERIYLGKRKDPRRLLSVSARLDDLQHIRLTIEEVENVSFEAPYVQIDSPFFYIKDGQMPGFFKGELHRWHAEKLIDHTPYFTRALPVGRSGIAVQSVVGTYGSNEMRNMLGRIAVDTPHVKMNPDALEGQADHYYSTMGVLRYDRDLDRLVYLYHYRNQYLVLDTALNVLDMGHTIDPVSEAQVKPVMVTDTTMTLASPPAVVNRNAQVYGEWLFVHSNLMARNETRRLFDRASVIDVYDISGKEYLFSFYVPDYENMKMESFRILKDGMIALHGPYVVNYDLGAHFSDIRFDNEHLLSAK